MMEQTFSQLGDISILQKNNHNKLNFQYSTPEHQMKNNMHFNKYHKTIKSALFNKKIEELEKYIKFKDKLEVKYFISGNPFLLDIIKESSGIINGIFKDRRLEISVENDPESITDFKFLYLKIYTEETPAKAINLLKKFDYEWWLGIKPNTKNKLVIGVEYE